MKKQKTLISILIINYNNGKLLTRAINSCLNQKYRNVEILVFDDKSTDNSKIILKKFENNKKVKIFFNKRQILHKINIFSFKKKFADFFNFIFMKIIITV